MTAIERLKAALEERSRAMHASEEAIKAAYPIGCRVSFRKGRHNLVGRVEANSYDLRVRTATGGQHRVGISKYGPLPEIVP